MNTKEIIGKLTPAHFRNGEQFDRVAFASLIDGLLKSRINRWKMPAIWLAGILLSLVFAGMGGAIGNLLAVACIFAGLIGGNLAVTGVSRQLREAMKTLGVTQRDINAAIRQVKNGMNHAPNEQDATAAAPKSAGSTRPARTWFIISCVSVILLHAFLLFIYVMNVSEGDTGDGGYHVHALANGIAIAGAVLMLRKQWWAYMPVLLSIGLFCKGMDIARQLDKDVTGVFIGLLSVLSVLLLVTAIFYCRSKRAAPGAAAKDFRLTRKHRLAGAGVTVAMILAIVLWPEGKYKQLYWSYDLYEAQLRETGKWGFVDAARQLEIVPCIYDETDRTYLILKVKRNGKWGMFDKAGNGIIPCRYDLIGDELSDSLLHVTQNGQHGLIHFDGREVVPCIYDEPLRNNASSSLLKAVLKGKHGFIDRSGKEIVAIQYDQADFAVHGGLRANLKGEEAYFDLSGNKVEKEPAVVAPAQAGNPESRRMKVNYDSAKERFVFTDVETGKPLRYTRIMLGDIEPAGIRYDYSQQAGGMIQFVTRAKKLLGTRQENGRTVTTYSGESTTSFTLSNELPYTLEDGVLTIIR
ncbi:MAG: WG repeat-containing protein [Prevotellaceae bacterium]|jgi:hypothetical protein|nr:WG repeat-containing protein [Prevotellaceae bacterium]